MQADSFKDKCSCCGLSEILSVFCIADSVLLFLQALVLKVGMDSIMASYFALFEVINHSFGKNSVFDVLSAFHMAISQSTFTYFHVFHFKALSTPSGVSSSHDHYFSKLRLVSCNCSV